ncbi:MAG: AMP-binding protein, partial [Clostridia bacterium]|nr:AMP-binding protein [Clostridia bacterium]
ISVACLTPSNSHREGSIGKPMPDTTIKIAAPDGDGTPLPIGEEGEICICGPTVMHSYIENSKETGETLQMHADGKLWLRTGDLGKIDEEGYVYFLQRIKRMIVTSGYNVYPSQIETLLDAHPAVQRSCVIGVDDSYRMKRVKAFIVLKNGTDASKTIKEEITEYLKVNVAKYSMPREIEFRDELPVTRIGKVAYRVLEEEEAAKMKA